VLEEGINGHMITLYDRGAHLPLLWTHLVPATLEGRALHNVQNAMFAAAVAYSLGMVLEDIRHGLRTFDATYFQAPGRLNVFDQHPFKVILDYAHNEAAVKAMVDLVERLRPAGKRIVVVSAPGDRRDEDVRAVARACAGRFDLYVCRRDDDPRGRRPDEVPAMLRRTLLDAGVPAAAIEVIPDEVPAVDAALRAAAPGDLLLVFGDQISRTWKQIIRFAPGAGGGGKEATAPTPARVELPTPASPPPADADELIRDERGVRLAREQDD
jgi:cyanophycin synthetase